MSNLIIYEFGSHLIALDLPWLITFVANNLWWLFALFAFTHFLTQGKPLKQNIRWFGIAVFYLWAVYDFQNITGWIIASSGFLAIHYIARLTVVFFSETIPQLQRRFTLMLLLQFIVVLAIYNLVVLNFL